MKYCMHCGQKLRDESKFCYRCGRPCAGEGMDDVQEELEEYGEFGTPGGAGADEDSVEIEERYGFAEFDGGGELPEDSESAEDEGLGDEGPEDEGLGDEGPEDEEPEDEGPEAGEFEDEEPEDEGPEAEELEDEDLEDEPRARAIPRKRYLEAVMEEAGESIYDDSEDEEFYSRGRKRRKKHSTAKFIIGIAVLALLMAYIFWSPARRAYLYAYSGDIESAESVYRDEVRPRPFERIVLQLLLPSGLDHAFDAYNRGGIAYEDAEARLKTFDTFDLTGNTAARKLNQLRTLRASKQAFAEAESARGSGDVKQAMLSYRKVVREDTNYEAAKERADACEESYKAQILELVGTPSTDEEYRAAIAALTEAVQVLPSDMEMSDQLTTLKQKFAADLKSRAVPAANEYIEQGNYKEAIDILNSALEFNQQDDDLLSMKNTAINRYEDFVKSQVSVYLGNKDVKGALELLERAIADLPDNQVFAQLYRSVRTDA